MTKSQGLVVISLFFPITIEDDDEPRACHRLLFLFHKLQMMTRRRRLVIFLFTIEDDNKSVLLPHVTFMKFYIKATHGRT